MSKIFDLNTAQWILGALFAVAAACIGVVNGTKWQILASLVSTISFTTAVGLEVYKTRRKLLDALSDRALRERFSHVPDDRARKGMERITELHIKLGSVKDTCRSNIIIQSLVDLGEYYADRLNEGLKTNSLTLPSERRLMVCTEAIRRAQHTIDAVSWGEDKWLLQGELIENYVEAHTGAVKRHVQCRRIFTHGEDSDSERDRALGVMIARQRAIGIEVRTVERRTIENVVYNESLNITLTNFLVIDADRDVSFLSKSDGRGPQHRGSVYLNDREKISEFSDGFNRIWKLIEERNLDKTAQFQALVDRVRSAGLGGIVSD